MIFKPNYRITQEILECLTKIEMIKNSFRDSKISPVLLASLKSSAKIETIHYSTKIEGNRLTRKEVEQIIFKRKVIENRIRDSSEVKSYYKAMNYIEKCLAQNLPFSEKLIKKTHDLVEGVRSPYRDGQNAIYDNASGDIVYLPPETKDVPALMNSLIDFVNNDKQTPRVIVAGLVHYQFVTIHPYYDGNGRTARLLTSFLMRKYGYGLKDIYSLEEYYANDLAGYYSAPATHPHHNYYEGRKNADLTGWIEYFVRGVADVFEKIQVRTQTTNFRKDFSDEMRQLDVTQRKILELFTEFQEVSSMQIAEYLGMSQQSARLLANRWVSDGFMIISNYSKKARKYRLAERFEELV
ncbi:MAG: Fic family protein [Alphaproteobacteria bacterium]|nr:Fic family protein [Alphaproteobacteria bacterium]